MVSTLRRRAEPRRAPAARRAVRGPAGCAPVSSGHAPGSVREAHSPGAGGASAVGVRRAPGAGLRAAGFSPSLARRGAEREARSPPFFPGP